MSIVVTMLTFPFQDLRVFTDSASPKSPRWVFLLNSSFLDYPFTGSPPHRLASYPSSIEPSGLWRHPCFFSTRCLRPLCGLNPKCLRSLTMSGKLWVLLVKNGIRGLNLGVSGCLSCYGYCFRQRTPERPFSFVSLTAQDLHQSLFPAYFIQELLDFHIFLLSYQHSSFLLDTI